MTLSRRTMIASAAALTVVPTLSLAEKHVKPMRVTKGGRYRLDKETLLLILAKPDMWGEIVIEDEENAVSLAEFMEKVQGTIEAKYRYNEDRPIALTKDPRMFDVSADVARKIGGLDDGEFIQSAVSGGYWVYGCFFFTYACVWMDA